MNELSINRQEQAALIHNRILANGQIAATALLGMCEDLKKMKDENLYEELGYSSFEDYAEKACGIKQRQAYSYIATYERLGADYIQLHANLGITKLEAISQISSYEREEFLETVDVEDISTRELKEEVQKFKNQVEQLTLNLEASQNECKKLSQDLKLSDGCNDILQKQIDELKAKPTEVAVAEVDEATIQQAVAQAGAEAQEEINQLKQKLKEEKAKTKKAETDKASAVKEAEEKAIKQANEKIDKLIADGKKKDAELQEALKAAKIAGADEDDIAVRILFNNLQSTANALIKHINAVREKDAKRADKFSAAVQKTVLALFGGAE